MVRNGGRVFPSTPTSGVKGISSNGPALIQIVGTRTFFNFTQPRVSLAFMLRYFMMVWPFSASTVDFDDKIDLIPFKQFLESFRHSAILQAYIHAYTVCTLIASDLCTKLKSHQSQDELVRHAVNCCSLCNCTTGSVPTLPA